MLPIYIRIYWRKRDSEHRPVVGKNPFLSANTTVVVIKDDGLFGVPDFHHLGSPAFGALTQGLTHDALRNYSATKWAYGNTCNANCVARWGNGSWLPACFITTAKKRHYGN